MTQEQAEQIVQRIFARFPRAHLSPAILDAWTGSFVDFDFHFAVQHLKPVITTATGDYPPPLNALRRILVDRRERERPREPEPPPATTIDETLGRSARAPIHKKYIAIVNYLVAHGELIQRKRGDPPRLGGRKRIEDRLQERYGPDREHERNWGWENGRAYPLPGTEGQRQREELGK